MAVEYSILCANCGTSFSVPKQRRDSAKACSVACSRALQSRKQKTPLKDRFWSKVEVRGVADCWPWKPVRGNSFAVKADDGKTAVASAAAYALHHGLDPRGLLVTQTCKNRQCCNPAHIEPRKPKKPRAGRVSIYALIDPCSGKPRYVGQTAQYLCNRLSQHVFVSDGSPKSLWVAGLVAQGLKPDIRLLEEVDAVLGVQAEASWIETLREAGEELTNEYDPDLSMPRPEGSCKKISAYRASRTGWHHSQRTKDRIGRYGEENAQSKLTADQVRDIKRRINEGQSQASISREAGVSKSAINKIAKGTSWRDVS